MCEKNRFGNSRLSETQIKSASALLDFGSFNSVKDIKGQATLILFILVTSKRVFLQIVSALANCEDSDENGHFHQGLHCLLK